MKYLEDLIFWVKERERIRLAREAGEPKPWTADPILRHYRFCNIRRSNDRVTRWIWKNWMIPNAGDPNLAFAMGVARMVNWTDTLSDLGYPKVWDPEHFVMTFETRKKQGLKCWTSAYMITGGYSKGGETKEAIIARVLSGLLEQLWRNPIVVGDTLEQAHEKLMVPGIGSFLGAQIVADIKFCSPLLAAPDWCTWCAPGPGSTLGLNYLHESSGGYTPKEFMKYVNEVRAILHNEGIELDAQDTQNCLCEFSKYVRAKYFGKPPKSSFTPDTRPL